MSTSAKIRAIDILLVEDNAGDIRLAQEALKQTKMINLLFAVTDGRQALAFLRRQEEYAGAARPDLILLDLNLPKKDGRRVLAEIKADPDLRRIPVVILTSSAAEEDILKTYNLHANCFVTKPVDFDRFMDVVRSIENFWVSIVKLPPK
jgi:chemotaxis family two-component system response regulator Rcp1